MSSYMYSILSSKRFVNKCLNEDETKKRKQDWSHIAADSKSLSLISQYKSTCVGLKWGDLRIKSES